MGVGLVKALARELGQLGPKDRESINQGRHLTIKPVGWQASSSHPSSQAAAAAATAASAAWFHISLSARGPARAQPTQLEPKWLYGVWKRCGCQRAFPNTATRTALTGAAFPNTDRKCADGRSVSKHCDATCAIYINICLYLSWYLYLCIYS